MQELAGKRVTVAGLGRFGGQITAARWLVEQGANVTVTDLEKAENLSESLQQLKEVSLTLHLGGHVEDDFTKSDLIVASPAIPLTSAHLELARKSGVPITTEIRLFIE